ncbi:hypothetical protein PF005_g11444 [Phytophthora fragariae]|uniref:Uncharacterized protein n=1 Tax=Phytophthora fragariae TaxID=53985 RepID=A0A6A3L080_9STRA|nr:hypothetical protein PF003_g35016 [Phytophthora fragariae]KAE9011397.1 hypothetical protein PF011_g9386 [Phytophthora fragariae]KAE9210392.1 hypothetical protein PF005_g11444 [Phytophthora fragariae]KAE9230640.1 hypothetical protein PF002_g12935 [Phytophthora fragariae]KAE9253583.1 hypothetical protein PF004_g1451 [Phytophthora fragariae]
MRRLNTAYESKDGRYATHICILCTQQQTSNPYAEPAWDSGLYRAGHTTNALDHM